MPDNIIDPCAVARRMGRADAKKSLGGDAAAAWPPPKADPGNGQLAPGARTARSTAPDLVSEPVTISLADVKPQRVHWLWPGRIAIGKVTLLAGDPGLGKSVVTLDMAARVTAGVPWPDDPNGMNPPGSVVLLSAEDDVADTIRPRLDAAGADCGRVVAFQAVKDTDPESDRSWLRPFRLGGDLSVLGEVLDTLDSPRLVVVDPVTAFLGGVDSHKNAELRGLLAPLADLAATHRVAVVAVTHLNKNAQAAAMYRAMGSLAFVAAARAVWAIVKDKDDGARRLMLCLKSNLARDMLGLAFRIGEQHVANVGDVPKIEWEPEPVEIEIDAALAPDQEGAEERSALAEAGDWLADVLADDSVEAKEIRRRAGADGIAARTLSRAKHNLGVVAERSGFGRGGRWVWRLPDHRLPSEPIEGQPQSVATYDDVGLLWDNQGGDASPDEWAHK